MLFLSMGWISFLNCLKLTPALQRLHIGCKLEMVAYYWLPAWFRHGCVDLLHILRDGFKINTIWLIGFQLIYSIIIWLGFKN